MPAIPKGHKFKFRRRIRTNKAEDKALAAFFALLETGRYDYAADLSGTEALAATGCRYLGKGAFKTAFALPGDRWVVKVANRLRNLVRDRDRFMAVSAHDVTVEGRMYVRSPEDVREYLAMTREVNGYATLQEMAVRTVSKVRDSERDLTVRNDVMSKRDAMIKFLGDRGVFGDLHDANLAVRSDGSVCVIDFALTGI